MWIDELQVGGASMARLLGVTNVPDDRTPHDERLYAHDLHDERLHPHHPGDPLKWALAGRWGGVRRGGVAGRRCALCLP
ncbi:hypothetical protein GCM10020001_031880 [Nonomuraea salmonea]